MKHKDALRTLKNAKGQVEAVIKMVEDNRYCIDISKQILATIALLKKANVQVLNSHLETCVKSAIFSEDVEEVDRKIQELEEVISYLNKIV
ncbi:CsoR family transcriptional regulator [Thermosipho affectus]|uniref:Copper-sensing transcriptional repressor CsoR n=1 Tax=Thermosipho affectus TaxID=660294 RepID=A0ABX3IIT9_9BACT|nr:MULTISPECIES: metal-sensing transcriptional repressor [Thermosipho]ANQ53261.1 copper-sensing transcriptional repressor [Thermosipho sp. 1070]APT71711.1 CsoR family transcriptional regulator [Thermosipho sp. 1063]ONN27735.1 CsoR family transcriptional regulator [Thermosipho affectus]OOC45226.1 CsoR family transcriptional regulator [Thermosipho sp. 1074]